MKALQVTFAAIIMACLLSACTQDRVDLSPDASKRIKNGTLTIPYALPQSAAYLFEESFFTIEDPALQTQQYRLEIDQPPFLPPHQFLITGIGEFENVQVTATRLNNQDFDIPLTVIDMEAYPGTVTLSGEGRMDHGSIELHYHMITAEREVFAKGFGKEIH